MTRVRIDKLLVDRGLVKSRERARALVMAGEVLVDDTPVLKAGSSVESRATVRLRRPEHPFVGRGGIKLRGALDTLGIDPSGWVCADVGSSTGGFTDCLLLAGAKRVYAIDVDTSQLDWKLRTDERVKPVMGNARYADLGWIGDPVDFLTVDVSFISLAKVFPALCLLLRSGGQCLALVKPQFELGRGNVPQGGVVTDSSRHAEAVSAVIAAAERSGFSRCGSCPSPITGKAGNREFFVLFERL